MGMGLFCHNYNWLDKISFTHYQCSPSSAPLPVLGYMFGCIPASPTKSFSFTFKLILRTDFNQSPQLNFIVNKYSICILFILRSSSFCTVIARERSRKVTKMILIAGGGPIPLEPQSCQVFGLPQCIFCCIKPIMTNVFARWVYCMSSWHHTMKIISMSMCSIGKQAWLLCAPHPSKGEKFPGCPTARMRGEAKVMEGGGYSGDKRYWGCATE